MNTYRSNWLYCVAAIGLACRGGHARAAPITFEFSGIIDFVEADLGLDPSVAVGASFTGNYAFDPETVVDSAPNDSRVGAYYFGSSSHLVVHVGSYEFLTNDLGITIWNNVTGEDLYRVGSAQPFFSAGRQWIIMAFFLQDLTATAFNSDALPLTPPDLAEFEYDMSLAIIEDGHSAAISGTLTSLVPEPSTLMTVGLTVSLCIGRSVRRLAGL